MYNDNILVLTYKIKDFPFDALYVAEAAVSLYVNFVG